LVTRANPLAHLAPPTSCDCVTLKLWFSCALCSNRRDTVGTNRSNPSWDRGPKIGQLDCHRAGTGSKETQNASDVEKHGWGRDGVNYVSQGHRTSPRALLRDSIGFVRLGGSPPHLEVRSWEIKPSTSLRVLRAPHPKFRTVAQT
jgi:hypothetical protein